MSQSVVEKKRILEMAHDMVPLFRRWFDHEKDSHRKVIESLESVPADQRGSAAFQKATSIMGHLIAARRLWLYRMGVTADRPAELFPAAASLDALKADQKGMEELWDQYLSTLTEAEIDQPVRYKSLDADWFESRLLDILTQLHTHSPYHRGQIASLVKASGGQPALTDFIYWGRQAIKPPE